MFQANPKIFKVYDVRGKYPSEINEKTMAFIAMALARHFGSGSRIVIGYDARLSSPSLYQSILKEFFYSDAAEKMKIKVIAAGMTTTPMLYFLVNKFKTDAGIMVTASHNPKEYNGLKVVGRNAEPVSGLEIRKFVNFFRPVDFNQPAVTPLKIRRSDFLNLYAEFLKKFLKTKRKLKIVFDCSNGVAGLALEKLLKGNGSINYTLLHEKPDGNFPGHGPDPSKRSAFRNLQLAVIKQQADLGAIFDADGDRIFFVDNRGRRIDPNEIAYILMRTHQPPYIASIVSSRRVKKYGQGVSLSRVGHYFVKKIMRQKKASVGAEPSGHYYFKDFFYCESGILTAVKIMNFVSGLKTDLAGWLDSLSPKYYRSGEINIKLKSGDEKLAAEILRRVEGFYKRGAVKISKLDGLTMEFPDWWFNLRFSNTENLLRLNVEANSEYALNEKLIEIKKIID